MADSLNSYTHAFYMSGAVVLAGACIPFLLLFTKTREPGARESLELDEREETGSIAMIRDTGEEIGTEPGSNRTNVVSVSSV